MKIGPLNLTRDSGALWLAALGAIVTYLLASAPPTDWGYHDWLKAAAAGLAFAAGKLQSSPLPHSEDANTITGGR